MRRVNVSAFLVSGLVALAASAALADGGGGSGSAEMPSISAPTFDPAAEYAAALAALQKNDFKNAARSLDKVTSVAPKNLAAWRLLGDTRASMIDWKASRRAFERAVKLDPNDAASHAGLGVALAKLKDAKAGGELSWLQAKSTACASTCADAVQLKTLTDTVQGAMSPDAKPTAQLDRRNLMLGGPKAGDAAYVQAVGMINERRYDDALKALAAAEVVFGPHPDIITYQGYTWRKKGDYARAESYYRQALDIAPGHRGATEYYGELKVEIGDTAGAKRLLARLDRVCTYGCAEAETLRRWIQVGGDPDLR